MAGMRKRETTWACSRYCWRPVPWHRRSRQKPRAATRCWPRSAGTAAVEVALAGGSAPAGHQFSGRLLPLREGEGKATLYQAAGDDLATLEDQLGLGTHQPRARGEHPLG